MNNSPVYWIEVHGDGDPDVVGGLTHELRELVEEDAAVVVTNPDLHLLDNEEPALDADAAVQELERMQQQLENQL